MEEWKTQIVDTKRKVTEGLLADRDYGEVAGTYDHSHNKFVCSKDSSINENILVHSKRQCVWYPLCDAVPGKHEICSGNNQGPQLYKI